MVRGVPSHSTVEPGTKPLPAIVTVGLLPMSADVGVRPFIGGRRVGDRLHHRPAGRRPGLVGDRDRGVVGPGAGVRMRVGEGDLGVACIGCQREAPALLTGRRSDPGRAEPGLHSPAQRRADQTAFPAVHGCRRPSPRTRSRCPGCRRGLSCRQGSWPAPNGDRPCLALGGRAVRVERQRGRHSRPPGRLKSSTACSPFFSRWRSVGPRKCRWSGRCSTSPPVL